MRVDNKFKLQDILKEKERLKMMTREAAIKSQMFVETMKQFIVHSKMDIKMQESLFPIKPSSKGISTPEKPLESSVKSEGFYEFDN